MRVFVTGHAGYIGAHLVALLKEAGHQVTGCDLHLFEGCDWAPSVPPDRDLAKDIRALGPDDLDGHDAVIHLAAISNDPMGELDPAVTRAINGDGSVHVAKVARAAGVPRFLFASSCAMYGRADGRALDESAPFNPVSVYAESKIYAERHIAALADETFSPVFLRNATAYGASPMVRLDLVVNNLVGCALARGDIRIMSDGSPWRPLVHAADIARAFLACLQAPRERLHNRAINVGGDGENYRVRDVAERVRARVPGAEVVYTGEVGADPRDYRVAFGLLGELLPGFALAYDLDSGMDELLASFRDRGFSRSDFDGDTYVRLRTLRHRLDRLRAA